MNKLTMAEFLKLGRYQKVEAMGRDDSHSYRRTTIDPGPCFKCGKPVWVNHYCFGCGRLVCSKCEGTPAHLDTCGLPDGSRN